MTAERRAELKREAERAVSIRVSNREKLLAEYLREALAEIEALYGSAMSRGGASGGRKQT